MKLGTKHKTLKCEDKTCQRFGEYLQYSKIEGCFVCPDTLIANNEVD